MIVVTETDSPMEEPEVVEVPVPEDFDSFFRREYPSVARLAFLLLGRTGEAEEVTQEAFISLLQRWQTIENPSGFVRTAAVNRCRDIKRQRGVRDRIVRSIRPPEHDPDDPEYLIDVLQAIPIQLRTVIVLRFYLGHTVPEIASIVGIAEGTAKSRLHRAIHELRGHLHYL